MVETIYKDVHGSYKRIIAIGGGTVIDISKFFSFKHTSPVLDLYDGKQEIVKDKELIIVPTTCGTGSEVTNIAVLSLNARGTKKGLAHDEMYGDYAVLIPELLKDLPLNFLQRAPSMQRNLPTVLLPISAPDGKQLCIP